MQVAYVIQNVGNIDFSQDVGDTVPVKNSLLGLQKAGHTVDCFRLTGQSVVRIPDVTAPERESDLPLGLTGNSLFRTLEGWGRRLQEMIGIPYYAFFDSMRFYEGCMRFLPGYDLCHEHSGLFSIGASLACARLKMPFVLTFSADPFIELQLVGKPLQGLHESVARKEMTFSLKVADRIICVSKQAKEHLERRWQVRPEKIIAMPNGVDIKLFSAKGDVKSLRREFTLDDDPVIGFVGGFQHWHGLDLLVESFSQLVQRFPKVKLLLVGDGPARENIERMVEKLGLGESTIFSGLVAQDRVPAFLSMVDIAVIPYPQLPKELWFSPLKLYEYMAAGKAVVATNSGQIAEVLVDGKNGLLVSAGDVDGLTAAISRLIDDYALRTSLGHNAQRQAIEKHSWDNYIKRLEGIYSDVLEERSQVGEQQGELMR